MTYTLIFIGGFVLGGLLIFIIMLRLQKKTEEISRNLAQKSEADKNREMEIMLERIKDSFGSLSIDALKKSTEEFLKLANTSLGEQSRLNSKQLESKKELIDQTLKNMRGDLGKVEEILQKVEKERKESYGQLAEQLKQSVDQTRRLQETTNQLNTALSHSQVRGQWGERMAEDVLRLAGFLEGVNYLKQKAVEGGAGRPDFTFLLPQDLKVNMDVKFPLDKYLSYLEAESEADKELFKSQFMRDVRSRIKEVRGKDYINPADNTVDYVIVFIPNEQVYEFINENDRGLLDDALRSKVILCSPLTLYAILAIIRQAVDNFNLEKTASEILNLLGEFNKQWALFKEGMDKMGRKIDDARNEFEKLTAARTKKLEKPLQQIENIRSRHQLALPESGPSENDE